MKIKKPKKKIHVSKELACFNQCLDIRQCCNDEQECYFRNNTKINYFGTITIRNSSTRCCLEVFINDCDGCESFTVLPGQSIVTVVRKLKSISVSAISAECHHDDIATGEIILQLHYCIEAC